MPISSYIVRCHPTFLNPVLRELRARGDLTIGPAVNNEIPIVSVTNTSQEAASLETQLQDMKGIRRAILVYHNFEEEHDLVS